MSADNAPAQCVFGDHDGRCEDCARSAKKTIRQRQLQPDTVINRRILFLWNRMEQQRAKYHNTDQRTLLQFVKDIEAFNEAVLAYNLACERYGVQAIWYEWVDKQ